MLTLTKNEVKKGKLQGTNAKDNFNLVDYAEKISIYTGCGTDTIYSGSGKTIIYGQSGKNIYNISVDNTDTTIVTGVGKAEINIPTFINESNLEKVKNDLKINIAPNNIVTIKDYFKNRGEIIVNGENIRNYTHYYNITENKKANLTTGFTKDNIKTNDTTAYNDLIKSLEGNDTISTFGGNDTIYAGDGDDTLIGGIGNDKLYGGTGKNTYEFTSSQFEGNDTIYIEQNSISDINISKSEISNVYKLKNDLILSNQAGEKITLANFFKYYQDVYIDDEFILSLVNNKTGNAFAINGKGKIEDTIFNDSITGSKGGDKIYSNYGYDKINAGKGNDKIYSYSEQANLYFNDGDGKDIIEGGFNEVFINTSNGNNLKFSKKGEDLIINYTEKDSITLKGFYDFWTDIKKLYVNGSQITGDLRSYVENTYVNAYRLTTGNNKFYSMPTNNKIILPDKFSLYNITNAVKSGNNLVLTGVYGPKDKLTIVDYYKNGYDITFVKQNGSSVGTLNKILFDVFQANTELGGNFSSIPFALNVKGGNINDNLILTEYDDIVKGGQGHDLVNGNLGNDKIWGEAGNDNLAGNKGNDSIYGGDGDDFIFGNEGNDLIKGGKGNDSILCENGRDKVYGETGNDFIDIETNNVYADGGAGNDQYCVLGNYNTIIAGSGNDYFGEVNTSNSKIDAGSGNDYFEKVNISYSTLIAGSGNDYIYLNLGEGNKVDAGSGNDQIDVYISKSEINGGSGNDLITVFTGDNEINAGTGNDFYRINLYNNKFEDDAGNDIYEIMNLGEDVSIEINDKRGEDVLLLHCNKEDIKVSFDVELNSKNKIVEVNDIDVIINAATTKIKIEDYFGSGCIEGFGTEEFYITKTQMQNVLQEVAAWLTTNGYSSTEMAYQQNGNEMPEELIAIFNDINWQQS